MVCIGVAELSGSRLDWDRTAWAGKLSINQRTSNEMSVSNRRAALRALLAAGTCAVPGSVFDPISARIADELGYPAGILGGSAASVTVLGAPDLMMLTLSELAEQTRRICRACSLPVIVDGDDGYGTALNVRRTIAEIEGAGAAGVTIEDSILPEIGMGQQSAHLVPLAEALGKVNAALDARTDPDFVIVARTSARGTDGVSEAARRCLAFANAGADAVLVTGIGSRKDLEAVTSGLGVPVILGSANAELRDLDYLAKQGVRLALPGHRPQKEAIFALYQAMMADAPATAQRGESLQSADTVFDRLTLAQAHRDWIERFISAGR
jgi:oxaloacetate decarboxylase